MEKKNTEDLIKILEDLLFASLPSSIRERVSPRNWELVKFIPEGEGVQVVLFDRKETTLPLPPGMRMPRFALLKTEEGLWMNNGYLLVGSKTAFFHGKLGEELKETLRFVQVLRPLFQALGHPDLEEALQALAELKGEEARFHGPYVLVWSGNPEEPAFLRKESLFGDPLLDMAFFLGREVVLQYPQVKVTLEGQLDNESRKRLFRMTKLVFDWEGTKASFVGGLSQGYLSCDLAFDEHPGACLIRKGAEAILARDLSDRKDPLFCKLRPNLLLPPKMRAFLETLIEAEDPLKALGDEDFFRRVALQLLSFF